MTSLANSTPPGSPRLTDPGGTHNRQMTMVRLAWATLAILTAVIFAVGIPAFYSIAGTPCSEGACIYLQLSHSDEQTFRELGLSLTQYAAVLSAMVIVTVLAFFATSAVLIWRQPGNRMAQFVSLGFILWGPMYSVSVTESLALTDPQWHLPVSALQALGIWFLVVFSFLFPDGRFVPRWTRLLAVVAAANTFALFLASPTRAVAFPETPIELLLSRVQIGLLIVGTLALIYRYRRASNPIERQQIKWVVFGFTAFIFEIIGFILLPSVIPTLHGPGLPRVMYLVLGAMVNSLFLLAFVLSFAIALLRFRLFDLDLIINRTLVYATLTVMMGAFYWASVVILQQLFGVLIGSSSQLAIIVSTLTIAVLFQPVRNRLQAEIDRRFYRSRYDSARVLTEFGTQARDQVDLAELARLLETAANQAMRPSHTSVWLRPPNRFRD